jgi:ABC-type multidrug transport system ATPase subunit
MLVAHNVGYQRGGDWAIRNISLTADRGELVGVLGPSGCGKTTLVNALLGRRTEGQVRTSGRVVYVPQEDMLWELLTPRETLRWAATLAGEGPVDLADWGLERCGDRPVRDLSGGQRRLLSIAVCETSHPSVILLDEPTSGLDAAAARKVMQYLVDRGRDRVTLATVHQPSEHIYRQLDSVLLVTQGRPVYFGRSMQLRSYLGGFGYGPQSFETLPELALRAVNVDFGGVDPEQVQMLLDAWIPPARRDDLDLASDPPEPPKGTVWSLLQRTTVIQFRDHPRLGMRGAAGGLGGVFLGLVYWGARAHEQRQILPRVWIVLWLMALPANLSAVTAWATTEELARVRHERTLYDPHKWLGARAAVDVAVATIVAFAVLAPAAYGIARFDPQESAPTWLITASMLWAFDGLAELAGATESPLNAVLVFLGSWFTSFLFSGMLVSPDQMPLQLAFLRYASPFFWAGRSIIRMELGSATYAGAHDCAGCVGGFECDADIPSASCYGRTGAQVLWSLNRSFSSAITPDDTLLYDVLGLVAIGVGTRLALLGIRWYQGRVG